MVKKIDLGRILRHLFTSPRLLDRLFPPASLAAIEKAIAASENSHGGEIRFAIEDSLSPRALLHGQTARERAIEVFSNLRVWDTEYNSGILIYLLLAERDVEIIVDRGINAKVAKSEWQSICRQMEASFRHGDFLGGVLAGIAAATEQLARHFPARGGQFDELPNKPVRL